MLITKGNPVENARVLRQATEQWKSFPSAVAAMITDAAARGATRVDVVYERDGTKTNLHVGDDGSAIADAAHLRNPTYVGHSIPLMPGYASAHHAAGCSITSGNYVTVTEMHNADGLDTGCSNSRKLATGADILWRDLGNGPGVNPQQDRSAARLAKSLGALLTPSMAAMVAIIDENGHSQILVVGKMMRELVSGYTFVYPTRMTDVSLMEQDGELRIAVDGRITSMREFISRLPPRFVLALKPLTSPWLRGTIEVTRNETASDFHALDLPTALADSCLCDRATRQVEGTSGGIWFRFVKTTDAFAFGDRNWRVGFACNSALCIGKTAVWIDDDLRANWVTALTVDPFHAVFQVDSNPRAIAERMLWTLATFLQKHLGQAPDPLAAYLELRASIAKNPLS